MLNKCMYVCIYIYVRVCLSENKVAKIWMVYHHCHCQCYNMFWVSLVATRIFNQYSIDEVLLFDGYI